jgi:hypothetical protein
MEPAGTWVEGGRSADFVVSADAGVPVRLLVRNPPVSNVVTLEGDGWRQYFVLAPGEERTAIDFPAPVLPPVDVFGDLRALAAPRGGVPSGFTGGIRGRVVAADGRPLPQALVTLQSDDFPSLIPPAIADEDGQYEFQKLSAGTFRVVAMKAGFVTMEYGRRRPSDSGEPIELRQGETRARVDIALPRPGALVGHVVDEDGEPIEGASVRLLQTQYRDGRRRLVSSGGQGSHRTDDRGAYRIYGVSPGEYIVSANVGQVVIGQPIADVSGYTTSYFPGTTNPGAAALPLSRKLVAAPALLFNSASRMALAEA